MANLLIFDDSVDILGMLEAMLHVHGHTVVGVDDITDFTNVLRQKDTDLIMLDINLKNEDGRTICKSIKEADETRHVPVILMSADPRFLRDYKKYCADAVIDKPFEMKKLLDTIDHLTL